MLHILTALLLALIISLPTPATAKDFLLEFNINVSGNTTVDAGAPIQRKGFRFADIYATTSTESVTLFVYAQLDDMESSSTPFKILLSNRVIHIPGTTVTTGLAHIPLTGKFITLQIKNATSSATDVTLKVVLRRK